MQLDYWLEKWKTGDTKFHMADVNEFLVQHYENLAPSTFFVPLCGKTLDMLWLATRGHKVVGVELSQIACDAFFSENKLSYEIKAVDGFILYFNESIQIWCGDIFQLPEHAYKDVNFIYDRAALFALPLDLRLQYVEKLKSIAAQSKKLQMLLLSIEYQQNLVQGPPFSLSNHDINNYYHDVFEIKQQSMPCGYISFLKQNPKFSEVDVIDSVYLLDCKS